MKPIFNKRIIAIIITVVGSITVFIGYSKSSSLSLLYANVKALEEVEHGIYERCYKMISSDPSDVVKYCGTCSEIPGRWRGGMSFCANQKKDTAEDTKN